ncbi:MAG TPA: alanine racemase, partial [Thermodesulfovibrionales bacterium]|nr:alanine racemase [Thermodesulfovibrionales bacterium]
DIPGLAIEGVLSHFSDADLLDRSFTDQQLDKFRRVREYLEKRLKRRILSHMANSSAVLSFEDAYLDMVRPGIALYGYSAVESFYDDKAPKGSDRGERKAKECVPMSGSLALHSALIPVMSVKTKILCLRNLPPGTPVSYGRTFVTKRRSRIGVIPLGYADGFSRLFSNNAEVLVRGGRAPVVGRVCMDLTMIDVTGIRGVQEGDEVVIIGTQGKEAVTADELSMRINTIPYEILTSLGSKSQRVYV